MPTPTHPALAPICERWRRRMAHLSRDSERLALVSDELPDLLLNRPVWIAVLDDLSGPARYADLRRAEMFDDEVLLHLDSGRRFSLRLFFFHPGSFTPVHDHSAWAASGTPDGTLAVVRYRRLDDGGDPGTARLQEVQRIELPPGQIDVALPLDDGIHATGNSGGAPIVMLSVYGRPLRRLHVNRFDPATGRVTPLVPPRLRKRRLAAQVHRVMTSRDE